MRGPRDTITPNLHGLVSDAATLAEAPYRRLGVRYSQSLLSGRRSTGLPAKEPN